MLTQLSTSLRDLTAIYLKMHFSSPNWTKSLRAILVLALTPSAYGTYLRREFQSHPPEAIFRDASLISMGSKKIGSLRRRMKLQSQLATT